MRRTLLTAATLLLVVTGLVPPASADTINVVGGRSGSGAEDAGTSCNAPTGRAMAWPDGLSHALVPTDDPDSPLGDRALEHSVPAAATDFAIGASAPTYDPGSEGTFDLRVKVVDDSLSGVVLVHYYPDLSALDLWFGYAFVELTETGWQTVDAENLQLTWRYWNDTNGAYDPSTTQATRTELVAANPGVDEAAWEGFAFGCGGGTTFRMDRLRAGPAGDVTTYDFQADVLEVLIAPSTGTITAGQSITLTADFVVFEAFVDSLTLEAKPYGAATFAPVAVVPFDLADFDPLPTSRVVPTKQTQYRWHFAGNSHFEADYSPITTVNVRTAVTMTPRSTRIRKGRNLVVTGSVLPRKGGQTIVLQRKVNGVWTAWKSTTTTSTGSYVIKKRMRTTGRRSIRVVAAASPGNLAGTSIVRRIRVVR